MKISGSVSALAVCVVINLPTHSAEKCSIHPPKGATDAQLTALAKVSQAQAHASALAGIRSVAKKTVQSAELEAEHGCLIWSFDVKLAGKPGVQEVQVDAGTGKVLSVRHESSQQESAEAAKEAQRPPQSPPK